MENLPAFIRTDVPLAAHTSFKVGGPARLFCAPKSPEEFAAALAFAKDRGLPFFLLGQGTNLVVSDSGYAGLILQTSENFHGIFWEEEGRVRAQAGALLHTVVTESVRRGLSGIQNLAGIPGTVGGGVYINAGAFGQELKDVVEEVLSVTWDGELKRRTGAECGFSYRHSGFFGLREVILESVMRLTPGDAAALREEMLDTLRKRKEKQPLHLPNAGSMFKRPPGQYAGTLIEGCGLKGLRRGGAQISEKHANFTVNAGGATAQDIFDLTSEVIAVVREKTGTTLEREVIFLGDFLPWPRPPVS